MVVWQSGILPLGRYQYFGKAQPEPLSGPELYLDSVHAALVVGQPRSRNELLVRWAAEASTSGWNVLLIGHTETPAGWRKVEVGDLELLPRGPLTKASSANRPACLRAGGTDNGGGQHAEWLSAHHPFGHVGRRTKGQPRIFARCPD